MKNIFLSLSAVALLSLASCGNINPDQGTPGSSEKKDKTPSEALTDATIVKPIFAHPDTSLQTQVQQLYHTYLQVQTALVNAKGAEAAIQAKNLGQLISSFDGKGLSVEQQQAYTNLALKIQGLAIRIGNTQDIKSQRTIFSPLSDHIYELLKVFGNDQPVYQTHCPMAFDGKGASWLSDTTAIRNPYYGSEMLDCGEVITIIKK